MWRNESGGAAAPRHAKACARWDLRRGSARASLLALAAALAAATLGGCASTEGAGFASGREPMFPESKWGVSASRRVAGHDGRIPKGGGIYKVGEPYQVGGRWYNPREQPDYDRIGTASWYGSDFHGRRTANGEVFDMHALTAAHPTLPLPSYAYVTNLANDRTILVRINDRGPYVGNRMIDLSRESARMLGLLSGGTGRVRVRYAGPAPLDGNDARERQFAASRPWNGGGTDVAALERGQSAREWTAGRDGAPAAAWVPPGRPYTAPSDGPQTERDGRVERYPQSFADAGPQPGGGELWSPERYRAAIASR